MWSKEKEKTLKTFSLENSKCCSQLSSQNGTLCINRDEIFLTDEVDTDVFQVAKRIIECGIEDDPFCLVDIENIIEKYQVWCEKIPRVKPFYAVKCNDHPFVLNVLAALGTGFDCASKEEMRKILTLGVDCSRIIFANPTKLPSHIKYANENGINLMTFDNEAELFKIKNFHPFAKLVLRIRSDAHIVQILLGNKFGCDLKTEAPALLRQARNMNLDVVGISFHVGSGCGEPEAFRRSIAAARELFELGRQLKFNMNLLDIGGGFRGYKNSSLDEVAEIINTALDVHFPYEYGVSIISEPGTYFVASAFTIVAEVHSKRCLDDPRNPGFKYNMYWIDDGLHTSFDIARFEPELIKPTVLRMSATNFSHLISSTIWGRIMTDNDYIKSNIKLPDLNIGDRLIFENMGAYSNAIARHVQTNPIPKVCALVGKGAKPFVKHLMRNGDYPVRALHQITFDQDDSMKSDRRLEHPLIISILSRLSNLCKRVGLWHTNRWHLT